MENSIASVCGAVWCYVVLCRHSYISKIVFAFKSAQLQAQLSTFCHSHSNNCLCLCCPIVQLSHLSTCPTDWLPHSLTVWLLLSRWLRLFVVVVVVVVVWLLRCFVVVHWRWSVWRLKVYLAAALECVGVAVVVGVAAKMKYECKQTAQLPQECQKTLAIKRILYTLTFNCINYGSI